MDIAAVANQVARWWDHLEPGRVAPLALISWSASREDDASCSMTYGGYRLTDLCRKHGAGAIKKALSLDMTKLTQVIMEPGKLSLANVLLRKREA